MNIFMHKLAILACIYGCSRDWVNGIRDVKLIVGRANLGHWLSHCQWVLVRSARQLEDIVSSYSTDPLSAGFSHNFGDCSTANVVMIQSIKMNRRWSNEHACHSAMPLLQYVWNRHHTDQVWLRLPWWLCRSVIALCSGLHHKARHWHIFLWRLDGIRLPFRSCSLCSFDKHY